MYQSHLTIINREKHIVIKRIKSYIQKHEFIITKKLKRKVFLNKYLEITTNRRDSRNRLLIFDCGIDILKNSTHIQTKIINKHLCINLIGKTANQEVIEVHLREDIELKNKKLYLISMFIKH